MPHRPLLQRPALLLLLLPAPVYAQLSAPATPDSTAPAATPAPATPDSSAPAAIPASPQPPVQRVEVKGAAYNERRQDTASKTVITREEILRFGDPNLSDVLKRLPGVSVGSGGAIRFRGLGNGYTQILLNGEPAPPGFQIDNLPPDSIEKIEIVRAASAEFSTQSIAGTINIVTRKVVQTAQREIKLTQSLDAGHDSTYINGVRSDKRGNFSYTINGSLFHGSFGDPSDTAMQEFDAAGRPLRLLAALHWFDGFFEGLTLNPRLNLKLANGDTLNWNGFVRFAHGGNTHSDTAQAAFGPQLPNPNNRGRFASRHYNFNQNLNWLHNLAGGGKLDLKLGHNYSQRHTESEFYGADLALRAQLARMNRAQTIDQGLTSTGKYSRTTASDHTLVLGWDGAYNQKREARLQWDSLPAGGDALSFVPINLDEHFTVKVSRVALFAQDEWSLNQNWSLYLGLRGESVQTDSGGTALAANRSRFHVISPIVQTLWKLPDSNNSQIRLALSRTYKAPSVENLNARRSISTDNSPTRPDRRGNPNLRPELASGLDLGIEHFLGEGALFSVNGYVRQIDDVNGTGLLFENGRYVSQPLNRGKAHSRGLELEAKFPLRAFWQAAPAVEVRASLNRSWSRVASIPGPDNRLDGQTPLSVNLGLDYKRDQMMLGGSLVWQNSGTVRTSAGQTSYASVTRTLDLYARWQFDPRNQMRLSLANLLHQDSFTESRYADDNGSVIQNQRTAGSIDIRLGFEHKF